MAVIVKFKLADKVGGVRHPTELIGHYRVFERDGHGPIMQIDTNGSQARAKPGKQSQTIQLDKSSAKELWLILGKEFGFSR